jgi:hypothetical protein
VKYTLYFQREYALGWEGLRNVLEKHRSQIQTLTSLEMECMLRDVDTVDSHMLTWLHSSSFNPAAARITLQALSGLRIDFSQNDALRAQLGFVLGKYKDECRQVDAKGGAFERCLRAGMHLSSPLLLFWPDDWQNLPAIRAFSDSVYAQEQPLIYQQATSEQGLFGTPLAIAFMAYAVSSNPPIQFHAIVWSELLDSVERWHYESNPSVPYFDIIVGDMQKHAWMILWHLVGDIEQIFIQVRKSTRSKDYSSVQDLRGFCSSALGLRATNVILCILRLCCLNQSDMPNDCVRLVRDVTVLTQVRVIIAIRLFTNYKTAL